MGEQAINIKTDKKSRIKYIKHLLDDLESLDYMLKNNLIEKDIVRIGAEQEFCLLNDQWRPAKNALEILEAINDDHFTTELTLYNLEINLDPVKLSGSAFKEVKQQLTKLLQKAEKAGDEQQTKILLTGILPSICAHELGMEYMTPLPRYETLNELISSSRGRNSSMYFQGIDEFLIRQDSIMFEGCNTSFQLHLQINADDFESSYNWSQAIAGPVLAVSVNSPLLLGNELWSETRIALFQQSIDTRKISSTQVNQQARVTFGDDWVSGSVLDYFKQEVSIYHIMLTKEIEKSSLEILEEGGIPKLKALNLHNGTIYKWNRPCYGVGNGVPHIRIENRYIPAGPTIEDEVANFAFWIGLMQGRPAKFDALHELMAFNQAKSNFTKAARYGTQTIMDWMGEKITTKKLIIETLIPIAKAGLKRMNSDTDDIDHYLNIIKKRVLGFTGSEWLITNYRTLKQDQKQDEAIIALTKSIYENQKKYNHLDEWENATKNETDNTAQQKVGHIMSTSLITANHNDAAILTFNYMEWNDIHHLPVVDEREHLVGLVTWQHLSEHGDFKSENFDGLSVDEIMLKDIFSTTSTTFVTEAKQLMIDNSIGCLPVLQKNRLVGIITRKDL